MSGVQMSPDPDGLFEVACIIAAGNAAIARALDPDHCLGPEAEVVRDSGVPTTMGFDTSRGSSTTTDPDIHAER